MDNYAGAVFTIGDHVLIGAAANRKPEYVGQVAKVLGSKAGKNRGAVKYRLGLTSGQIIWVPSNGLTAAAPGTFTDLPITVGDTVIIQAAPVGFGVRKPSIVGKNAKVSEVLGTLRGADGFAVEITGESDGTNGHYELWGGLYKANATVPTPVVAEGDGIYLSAAARAYLLGGLDAIAAGNPADAAAGLIEFLEGEAD